VLKAFSGPIYMKIYKLHYIVSVQMISCS